MKSILSLAAILAFTGYVHADESFVGLGFVIQSEKKNIQITEILEDSPASRANIVAGQWITAVDGQSTDGKSLKEASEMLRGEIGTKVTLSLKDNLSDTSARDVELVRDLIVIKCFMEGNINLRFQPNGSPNSGTLNGNIGNEFVYTSTYNGLLNFFFKQKYLNLTVDNDLSGNIHITGWVNGSFIDWRGFNNNISSYQACVR